MKSRTLEMKKIWAQHDEHRAFMPLYATQQMIDKRLAAILCPGPSYYYIFNFANFKFDFFSPELEELMGLSLDTSTLDTFLSRVHQNDLDFMQQCETMAGNFLFTSILKAQIPDYKVCYSYRMQDKKGDYRLILQQSVVVSMDIAGRISKVLGVHTMVDHLMDKNNYKISFVGMNGQPSYLAQGVLEEQQDIQVVQNPLSNREVQIVRLLADGDSTKDIAKLLNITENTVNVHRQNILKKTACKNVAHLVAVSIRSGWI